MTLAYSPVDSRSPIPLYHQIYLDLRQIIQRGDILPGGLLPPEMEICQAYSVGRQTVRQAIARLVDENIVERFAGRGTFVREQPGHTQFFLDRSFSQQMRELGRVPHSRLLSVETGTVNAENIPALQIWKGAACLTIERLRLGDDEPICHQTSTVLTERCPGLEQQDFSAQSLYEILSSRYQLVITRIDHVVRAIAADEYRADLLNVPAGTPLLFVGTTAYTEDGDVIEHSSSYYRADRYEYSTTQTCCA
ncbi:MAG: GntR family transcriptional regulator [Chloroflexi bacterium]|jgi:GntR family transcriptional regulator|nr:GntR family transcriptional regulator [Chloroflexota bacterium]